MNSEKIHSSLPFEQLWNSNDAKRWKEAFKHYWKLVEPSKKELEEKFEQMKHSEISKFNAIEWYNFLLNDYLRWKYTSPNKYAIKTALLRSYKDNNNLDELLTLRNEILNLENEVISVALKKTMEIRGLGILGASGLLAILFPRNFGTVDQLVVKRLYEVSNLPEREKILTIKYPENLTLFQGEVLIDIMRRKAHELNSQNKTEFWTPRKVEMVFCAFGRTL